MMKKAYNRGNGFARSAPFFVPFVVKKHLAKPA